MLSLCCFTVEISVHEIPGHAARFIGEPSHSPLPLRVTAQISQLFLSRRGPETPQIWVMY